MTLRVLLCEVDKINVAQTVGDTGPGCVCRGGGSLKSRESTGLGPTHTGRHPHTPGLEEGLGIGGLVDFAGAPGRTGDENERQTGASLFTCLNPGSHMYRSPLATSNRLVWKKGPQSRGQGESLLLHAPPLAPSDLDLRTCASFCRRRPPADGEHGAVLRRALSRGNPSEGTNWSGAEAAGGGGHTGWPDPEGLQAWEGAFLLSNTHREALKGLKQASGLARLVSLEGHPAAVWGVSRRTQTGSMEMTNAHTGENAKDTRRQSRVDVAETAVVTSAWS